MIGQSIAHYKVTAKLGEGGMGVVYRATDTKLGRDVALKVLPENLAADGERMARFEREAQLLAALNHANIAGIYGLEECAGPEGSGRALAMELVEGPTLAERLAEGPLPLSEALPLAKQIVEALEYAHEKGIVHRDLKPANIKLTADGKVKVLDFGLAKALEGAPAAADISASPTITAAATRVGVILGTAAYMAPEQAKGKPADRRADIWAFGVVLFEMLTGQRAFHGEDVSEVLASVLKSDVGWAALPSDAPPQLHKLLRRCLERDLRRRLQAIGEARIALEECMAAPAGASVLMSAAAVPAPRPWRRALPWAVAGVMTLAFAAALVALLRIPSPPTPEPARFEMDMADFNYAGGSGSRVAVSPDGRRIVATLTASGSQVSRLYLRNLDDLEFRPIAGTEGGRQPFLSPDSQWVGFSADGKLKKVPLTGGSPVPLCDAPGGAGVAATWMDDGNILFLDNDGKLRRIPEGGGTPEKIAASGSSTGDRYRWLAALPGSRGVLLVVTEQSKFSVDVLGLETGKRERIIEDGSWPRYLPTGHILYAQHSPGGESAGFTGGLLVVPFDLKSLKRTGSPIPVLEDVHTGSGGAGYYDVAADGMLAYRPGTSTATTKTLAWLDRSGKLQPLPAPPRSFRNVALSTDAMRAALEIFSSGATQDIHVYDLKRGTLQRLTFDGVNSSPVFTPDGARVIYASAASSREPTNLWWRPADGSGTPERLTTSTCRQYPTSISRDGTLLAFVENCPSARSDVFVMALSGDRKPQAVIQTPFSDVLGMFSPDGKWMAYMSDESGRYEIYVQAFPGPGGKTPISTDGGVTPVWSHDGKQLYFTTLGTSGADLLMAVDVSAQPAFRAGKPRVAAEGLRITQRGARNFDVAADGRILIVRRPEQEQQERSQLRVILNFTSEVRRRLPAAKP